MVSPPDSSCSGGRRTSRGLLRNSARTSGARGARRDAAHASSHRTVKCRLRGINVEDWTTFYEKQTGKVLVTNLRPSWLIFSDGFRKTHTTRTVKRAMDIALASIVLVVTFPVMVAVACAIKLTSRGPVLFRQQRVGEGERIFVLNKFLLDVRRRRTNGPVWASTHDPRGQRRIGCLLRRTRLDELPQCWNVLIGDMSFVGPRPERPEFVATLQADSIRRHSLCDLGSPWAQASLSLCGVGRRLPGRAGTPSTTSRICRFSWIWSFS